MCRGGESSKTIFQWSNNKEKKKSELFVGLYKFKERRKEKNENRKRYCRSRDVYGKENKEYPIFLNRSNWKFLVCISVFLRIKLKSS